jgi:hypothetical protein
MWRITSVPLLNALRALDYLVRERTKAAIQRPPKCHAAAFGLRPFVHRAASNVAECLLCGRGEQTRPIE